MMDEAKSFRGAAQRKKVSERFQKIPKCFAHFLQGEKLQSTEPEATRGRFTTLHLGLHELRVKFVGHTSFFPRTLNTQYR